MPRKVFTAGEVLAAADVNSFLMDQTVMTFAGTAARSSAIGTATEGMVTWLNDQNALQVYDGTQWNGLAASGGNAIINGGFDIWQRGTNFPLVSAVASATADRFLAVFNGSGTHTVSQQVNTSLIGPFTPNFFLRWNQSVAGSGGSFADLIQKVEGVRTFANETVTLSFYAKSASSVTMPSIIIYQDFGVGGSSSVTVPVTTNTVIGTSWTRFSFTFSMPSVVGKTIGANNQFEIHWTMPLNQTHTTDFWGVQLEAGPTANVFRRNANSLQGELAACQRYYFRATGSQTFSALALGISISSTRSHFQFKVPVSMRTLPTSVEYSNLCVFNGLNNSALITSLTLSLFNPEGSAGGPILTADYPAYQSAGLPLYLGTSGTTTPQFVAVSAEL